MSNTILELKNVNAYYEKSHILFDLSLKVEEGQSVCLLGRNGVGKSTTMKTIMGLLNPKVHDKTEGEILLNGKNIVGLTNFKIANLGIAYVPQGRHIFPNLTTKENLEQIKFHSPNMEGKVSFDYKQHDGLFTIGINDYSFITKWSECGTNSIYCYKDKIKRIGYNPSYSDFPKSNELVSFNYSSRVRTLKIGEIIILENNYNKFAAIKILNVVKQKVDINHLLEFEYKIYTIL